MTRKEIRRVTWSTSTWPATHFVDEEAEHETMYNDYNQQIINIERYVYKIDKKVTTQTKYREAACIKELTFTNNNIQPHFLSVLNSFTKSKQYKTWAYKRCCSYI